MEGSRDPGGAADRASEIDSLKGDPELKSNLILQQGDRALIVVPSRSVTSP